MKIITPGTLIEPLHTDANYLLSIATSSGSTVGLAWVDISTAEIKVQCTDLSNAPLWNQWFSMLKCSAL